MKIKIPGILVGLAFLLTGCPDPPEYEIFPIVEFDEFYANGEVGFLTIAFTDGDGDVGLTPEMTDPPFDEGSEYHNNLFVEYWEYNDAIGEWEHATDALNEPITFKYRIPWLTPTGKNKALKGTIQVKIEPNYRDINSPYSDSIRYRIKLVDRALHESEWVFTPPISNGVVVQ